MSDLGASVMSILASPVKVQKNGQQTQLCKSRSKQQLCHNGTSMLSGSTLSAACTEPSSVRVRRSVAEHKCEHLQLSHLNLLAKARNRGCYRVQSLVLVPLHMGKKLDQRHTLCAALNSSLVATH